MTTLRVAIKGSSRSGHFGHEGRPGRVGGSAPKGSHTDDPNYEAKRANARENLRKYRAKIQARNQKNNLPEHVNNILNYTNNRVKANEQFSESVIETIEGIVDKPYLEKEVQQQTEQMIADCAVLLRADHSLLEQIFADGEFKNQFAVQSSGGTYDPRYRAHIEEKYFGIEDANKDTTKWQYTDADKRPIYGYMADTIKASADNTYHYGDVIFELTDDVRERTTFTGFDSLDVYYEEEFLPASPVNNPNWKSLISMYDEFAVNTSKPSETDNERIYIEAQIHGGVKTENIKRIWFMDRGYKLDTISSYDYQRLQAWLQEKYPSIEVRHIKSSDPDVDLR